MALGRERVQLGHQRDVGLSTHAWCSHSSPSGQTPWAAARAGGSAGRGTVRPARCRRRRGGRGSWDRPWHARRTAPRSPSGALRGGGGQVQCAHRHPVRLSEPGLPVGNIARRAAGQGDRGHRPAAARMARPKEPTEPTEEDARVMNIVVCVKYVPDAQADRTFTESDNTTDRVGVDGLLSELDEYAVEEALKIGEAGEGDEVTVLTVGPGAGRGRDQEGPADGRRQGRPRQRRRDPRLRRRGDLAGPGRGDREDRRRRPGAHRDGLDRRHDGRRPGDARRAARAAAGDVRLRADRRRAAR